MVNHDAESIQRLLESKAMIVCTYCHMTVKCPQCEDWLCPYCGNDLAEDIPFGEEDDDQEH